VQRETDFVDKWIGAKVASHHSSDRLILSVLLAKAKAFI
jgi:hypothetical protein